MVRTMRSLLVATLLLCTSRAAAGNDDGVLVGGQAALTGGALTAYVSDGSAAWYNPAGLATLTRAKLDISGSTYGISHTTARNLFTLPDGSRSSASVVDWQLIPTALSYARRVSDKLVAAFGVFIPYSSDTNLRTSVRQMDGSRWTFDSDQLRNDYSYIASLSMKVSPTLRWGVALHGVFISNEQLSQVGVGMPGQPNTSFALVAQHSQTDDYGARIGAGVQWDMHPDFTVGLALQTPTLTAFRDVTRSELIGSSSSEGGLFQANEDDGLKSVWEFSTPLMVRLGLAYTEGRLQWLGDASVSSPLRTSERALDRKLSNNTRVACLYRLSDTLTLGAAVFNDRNGLRRAGVDFLGATLGLRFANEYHIVEGGRPLTFSTTVGVRYAYGWGRTQGLAIRASNEPSFEDFEETSTRLRVNEAAINLGSGVSY